MSECCQCPGPREAPGLCGVCCKASRAWCSRRAAPRCLHNPFPQATAANGSTSWAPTSAAAVKESSVFFLIQLAAEITAMAVTAHLAVNRHLLVSWWAMGRHTASCAWHPWRNSWAQTPDRTTEGCSFSNVVILPKKHHKLDVAWLVWSWY